MIILATPTPQGRTHVELNGRPAAVTVILTRIIYHDRRSHEFSSDLHTFADDLRMSAL